MLSVKSVARSIYSFLTNIISSTINLFVPPQAFQNKRFLHLCHYVIGEYLVISGVGLLSFGLYSLYRENMVWAEYALFILGIMGPLTGALLLRLTARATASVIYSNIIGIFLIFLYALLTDGIASPAVPLIGAFLVMGGGFGKGIVTITISAIVFLSIFVLYVLSESDMLPGYQINLENAAQVRFLGYFAFVILVSVALFLITNARKVRDKRLSLALERALVANEAKSQFLANMSHELRTPLNAIIGFSDILKNQTFGLIENPKYVEYSNYIHSSGQHLLKLINDVLDISVIESKNVEINASKLDPVDLVESCLSMLQERSEIAGIRLVAFPSPDLPKLLADETRVKQIMLNLIGNALKFSPSGSDVKIKIYRDLQEGLTIEVVDLGIGIAKEDITRIITPYEQIKEAGTGLNDGVGLGLFITNRLIELHGGKLEIESILGSGTNIFVRFPKERVIEKQEAA